MFFFISLIASITLAYSDEFPKRLVTQFEVPPGHDWATGMKGVSETWRDGDRYLHIHREGRTPDGRAVTYDFKAEMHVGPSPGQPQAAPTAPARSTLGNVVQGAGVMIMIYESVDQARRTARESEDLARRLRDFADHGVRVTHLNAMEQRALAQELERRSAERLERKMVAAGISSSRLHLDKGDVTPRAAPDPVALCAAPTIQADFRGAKLGQDAQGLSEFVNVALNHPGTECDRLAPNVTNGDMILQSQKVDSGSPSSALDDHAFLTPVESDAGRSLRTLANDYQALWLDNSGFRASPPKAELFDAGAILLGAADDAYARGAGAEGGRWRDAARITRDILRGTRDGVMGSVEDLARTAPALGAALRDAALLGYRDPAQFAKSAQRMILEVPEVARGVYAALVKDFKTLRDGSAYERSKLIGREVTTQMAGLLGGQVLRAAGTGTRILTSSARASIVESRAASLLKRYQDHIRGEWLLPAIDEAQVARLAGRMQEAEVHLAKAGTVPSAHATDFMANRAVIAAEMGIELTGEELAQHGIRYTSFEIRMANLSLTEFEGDVTRAIPKIFEVRTPGVPLPTIIEHTESDVMKFTSHGWLAVNRYSDRGVANLYVGVGAGPEIQKHLALEVRNVAEALVYKTDKFSLRNVLDLTNKGNLSQLGIQESEILQLDYNLTHALGHAAKSRGVEAILFPSAQSSFKNIVIF